jgi:predicted nucleic acid-binding Zn ribbon protein
MRSATNRSEKKKGVISPLADVLHDLLRSWGIDNKIREQQTVSGWEQIVGPRIAAHTTALRVEDGKVFIRTQSSSWKTELIFMKKDIIDRLNQAVGKKVITDIVFVAGGNGCLSTSREHGID